MRLLLVIILLILAAGCKGATGEKVSPEEEARRRDVFWQFEEPRVQLDPIKEEEVPSVLYPASPGTEGEN